MSYVSYYILMYNCFMALQTHLNKNDLKITFSYHSMIAIKPINYGESITRASLFSCCKWPGHFLFKIDSSTLSMSKLVNKYS